MAAIRKIAEWKLSVIPSKVDHAAILYEIEENLKNPRVSANIGLPKNT